MRPLEGLENKDIFPLFLASGLEVKEKENDEANHETKEDRCREPAVLRIFSMLIIPVIIRIVLRLLLNASPGRFREQGDRFILPCQWFRGWRGIRRRTVIIRRIGAEGSWFLLLSLFFPFLSLMRTLGDLENKEISFLFPASGLGVKENNEANREIKGGRCRGLAAPLVLLILLLLLLNASSEWWKECRGLSVAPCQRSRD